MSKGVNDARKTQLQIVLETLQLYLIHASWSGRLTLLSHNSSTKQWHEQVPPESPASDGTLVLTEHLSSSNGPSPQARGGVGFGRYGGARPETGSLGSFGGGGGGSGDGNTSKVEQALFSCLMSLGVRRLLLQKGAGGAVAGAGNRRRCVWVGV